MPTRGRPTSRSGFPGTRDKASRGAATPAHAPTGGPTSGDLAGHRLRLREVIEPVAAGGGYDLEELSVVRMGRRYVVRVTVDRDGGVGLDAVADLSRAISAALDDAEASGGEFIAGEYQLEVSSPGVDRPLVAPRHWRRNVGRLVTVSVAGRPVTARIEAADDTGVTLSGSGPHPYAELGRGRIEVEFARIDEVDDDDMVAFDDDRGEDDADDDEAADDGDEEDVR